MMNKSNTCQYCAYWVPDGDSPSARKTGTCHFWPPARSKHVSAVTTEQVENPVISDLKLRLSTAESFQAKLESQSKYVFAEYPVKMTYEELQAARVVLRRSLSTSRTLGTVGTARLLASIAASHPDGPSL